MLKIKSLFALSALILFVPTPARAEWIQMGTLKDNSEIYIDVDSATVRNSSVTFWQRRSFAIPQNNGTQTTDAKMIIDCRSGRIKATQQTLFDSYGQVLFKSSVNDPFKIINANSVQADVADFLCH